MYRWEQHVCAGRRLSVYRPEGDGPFPVVWLCAGDAGELAEQLAEDCPVPVLFCTAEADWNRDYTPWPAPGLRDRADFGGDGRAYLDLLCKEMQPFVQAQYPVYPDAAHTAIMGYSLGGLFALWAAVESDAFGVAASLSGSLWYDGFLDYVNKTKCKPINQLYLSLGKSEEWVGDPRMAAVGDCTRAMYAHFLLLLGEENVTLVWNRGGHFTGIPNRWRKAMEWVTKTW